ncbi:MAG: hypothetical protein IPO00_17275 [Betaproteobacteria bacterium]|nr:hypothetical protein [Betaproteobacteria bacterium]
MRCAGITEVDPARSNLLFERFISRERGEPPIDVDFEHERREERGAVHLCKYGRERAALAGGVDHVSHARCAARCRPRTRFSTAQIDVLSGSAGVLG